MALEPDGGDRAVAGTAEVMRRIAEALHDMCQPLTALQCRLEIGQIHGTAEAYEEAVTEALRESERLLVSVTAMRELVRQTLEEASDEIETGLDRNN
jgi:signal transduction histidine kinase